MSRAGPRVPQERSARAGNAGGSGATSAAACARNWQSGQWSSQSPGGEGLPFSSDWTQSEAASPNVAFSSAATDATPTAAGAGTGADSAW